MNSIKYLFSLFSVDDYKLLQLYFTDHPEQQVLDSVLSSFVIDNEPLERIYLLTKIHTKHPELLFPAKINPRLEGLIKYFIVGNATLLQGFNCIADELEKNNIPIMLMKGIALKFYFPREPRYMWDVDILVHDRDYKKAIELAVKQGFEIEYIGVHASDLIKGRAKIDIHNLFAKGMLNNPKFTQRIFDDATLHDCFGTRAYVPAIEDLLLIIIANAYHNYFPYGFANEITHPYTTFIDLENIFEKFPDLNWQNLFRNADNIGMLYQFEFFLSAFNHLRPNCLPEDLLKHLNASEKKWDMEVKRDLLLKDIKRKRLESFNKKTVSGLLSYFQKYTQYFYLITLYVFRMKKLIEKHHDSKVY